MLLRPKGQIIKMREIAINRHFDSFSAIIELVRQLVISKMHNKFGKDMRKTFLSKC